MFVFSLGGATRADDDRAVLEGVPKIGYDVHLCPFPGSLYAVLEYLGDPCDYDYLMGVTGAAFRRLWNKDDGGNVDLMYLAPEPYERAAKALGRELRFIGSKDRAELIREIKASIAEGRPVLAFGIIGPPECGIVTGHDRGGAVLYGWSYFQDPQLKGYYEKADWFERGTETGPPSLLIVGPKKEGEEAPRHDTFISSLEWAIDLARTPRRPSLPNHVAGLAAYDAWANGLEVDADYPMDDRKVMETRGMVQTDQCVMLHERNSAAKYLRSMLDVAPEAAADLDAAAALYEEAASMGGDLWLGGEWNDPAVQKRFADPALRRKMAASVRIARDKETRAVEHLEAALRLLKGAQ